MSLTKLLRLQLFIQGLFMLNMIDLERRWLRYKVKSYLPYLLLISSIVLLSAVVYTYLSLKPKTEKLQELNTTTLVEREQNLTTPEVPTTEEVVSQEIAVKENAQEPSDALEQKLPTDTLEVEETKAPPSRVFAPSMSFMQETQSDSKPYYENPSIQETKTSPVIEETYEEESIEDVVYDVEEQYAQEAQPQIYEQPESKKINIKRKDMQEDLAGIIVRFKKSNNPALSLFLAKKYYELADYHNAYNYALITNDLNRDIEPSWIIFSKSLVKLGKKSLAVKTLKEYISTSKSQSAKILLDEIESGKFK